MDKIKKGAKATQDDSPFLSPRVGAKEPEESYRS